MSAITTVHFEDKGQDFLEWDLDEKNVVVGCRPFQGSVWVGNRVMNKAIKPGCHLRFKSDKLKAHGSNASVVLKYRVIAVEQKED